MTPEGKRSAILFTKGEEIMFGHKKEKFTETIKVSGMKCPMCVKHVNNALTAVKGVQSVVVSLSDGTAVITSNRQLSEDELKNAIVATGYGYEGLVK